MEGQSEYPKVLGHNPATGTEIVQIDSRTVQMGTLKFHLTPKELISERGTGRSYLRNPFKGLKGMHYEYLLEEHPEECQRLDFSGEMEPYLDTVVHRWIARVGELTQAWEPKWAGIRDYMQKVQTIERYYATAREIATKEIILNY